MNLFLTFWICKVIASGEPNVGYYGSGLTRDEAEMAAVKICIEDGNAACIVKRCGTELLPEDKN